jgi:tetratricopeptide (TPR) repeat protein
MAFSLSYMGRAAFARAEYDEAKKFHEESLPLFQEAGIERTLGETLLSVGDVGLMQDEYEVAKARYREALAQFKHLGHDFGMLGALNGLGRVALAAQDHAMAMRHYRQARAITVQTHFDPFGSDVRRRLDVVTGIASLLEATDKERAIELAALVRHHPSCPRETQGTAQRLLDHLLTQLAPAAFAAAQERGQSQELLDTVRELHQAIGDE